MPENTGWNSSLREVQLKAERQSKELRRVYLRVFPILESEIDVQHIVRALHIEIFGVETVVTVLAVAGDKAGLLVSSGLYVPVVEHIVDLKRESKIILALNLPALADAAVQNEGGIELLLGGHILDLGGSFNSVSSAAGQMGAVQRVHIKVRMSEILPSELEEPVVVGTVVQLDGGSKLGS